MRFHCPTCRHAYDFPVELLRDEPFIGQCAVCAVPLRITSEGAVSGALPAGSAEEADTPRVADLPPEPAVGLTEEPTAVRIARIEVQRAALEAASAAGAGPPEVAGEAPDAERGDYLIVRGEVRTRPEARRRVVFTASPPTGERRTVRSSRVIAHSARFGRRAPEEEPAGPPPAVVASAGSSPSVVAPPQRSDLGRRVPLLFGRAFVLSAAVLAVAVNVMLRGLDRIQESDEPRPRPAPPASGPAPAPESVPTAAPATAAPSPTAAPRLVQFVPVAAAGAPDPEVRRIEIRVDSIKAYPKAGVVAVFGVLSNLSNHPWREIQLDVRLLVGPQPIRRRDVWCCDDLAPDAVDAVATDPAHRHFQSTRDAATLTELPLDEDRSFTVLFPALGARLAEADSPPFNAEVEIVRALPATPPP